MAAAQDPSEVLRSTSGKTNFQRVARLLISGGTALVKEIFDQLCPPSSLPTKLKDPATKSKAAKLFKAQRDCLYPSPGVYGKSEDFDLTLLFSLLRIICNVTPPALPTSTDLRLVADLARIKDYRNSVYAHVNQNMEITDDEFPSLWEEISEVLVRIAGQISHTKKTEWQGAIDDFLKDPLTSDDERNVQELIKWYENDTEVKKSVEELKNTTQKGFERLGTSLEEKGQNLETTVRGEAQEIKAHLGKQLSTTTELVNEEMERLETSLKGVHGGLEAAVREETQDIKDKLEDIKDKLSSQAESSVSSGGKLKRHIVSPLILIFASSFLQADTNQIRKLPLFLIPSQQFLPKPKFDKIIT